MARSGTQGNLPEFDESFDVVVIGFGFAGAASALAAADTGASVLLIEKMLDPGGISICAGGGVRIAKDADKAFAYLNETNDGRTPEDILKVFAQGMTELEAYFRELAKINDAEILIREREGNYPYTGYDTFGFIEIEKIPGFDMTEAYPHARGRLGGPNVFKVMEDNVRARENIEVRLGCPAERLISGPYNEVLGLEMTDNGVRKTVKARRGVILACGGFEAAPAIQEQFWQMAPVTSAANRGNTGDGIRMASSLGADLWHMWHYHGSYGFKHPDPRETQGIRMKRLPDWTPKVKPMDVQMAWITVDRAGKRYANECPPYAQDTSARDMDYVNTNEMDYPRVPSFVIVDDAGRQMYPLGQFVYNDRDAIPYEWSKDNMKEVQNGLLKTAPTIEGLAEALGIDAPALKETVARWNAMCEAGADADFDRPAGSMVPIKTPPFFGGAVYPIVSNTQGGPRHDARQRVVNAYNEPIPRLYEAGECGSIWGFLYMTGGNLSECFIGGRIAGAEAGLLDPWD